MIAGSPIKKGEEAGDSTTSKTGQMSLIQQIELLLVPMNWSSAKKENYEKTMIFIDILHFEYAHLVHHDILIVTVHEYFCVLQLVL